MTDDDLGLLLIAAVAAAALSMLLAASKRWNPSHESWIQFPVPWPYVRTVIQILGCGLIVVGLVGLLARANGAILVAGAGAMLLGALFVVKLLLGASDDDDL